MRYDSKSHCANHNTAKEVKMKILVSLNEALEKTIRVALNNKQKIFEKILKSNGFILYYQVTNPYESENSLNRYYQLTVSDEF
ncbi:9451_t:CDS:2 [Funneliformis caledonium]|uniref:9451_t:CDS:1 n=1 Tax=Funneliformis caledonium TaxID=1117310 RepID=A0A9N8W578_9GLOM|nr:9451_t:CDS:2 [Funneliformis caledonium]